MQIVACGDQNGVCGWVLRHLAPIGGGVPEREPRGGLLSTGGRSCGHTAQLYVLGLAQDRQQRGARKITRAHDAEADLSSKRAGGGLNVNACAYWRLGNGYR